MNRRLCFDEEFGPRADLSEAERRGMLALAERLVDERPVPSAAFRGELGRHLAGRTVSRGLRLRIAASAATGAVLLVLALVGALGSGPLAPEQVAPDTALQAGLSAESQLCSTC